MKVSSTKRFLAWVIAVLMVVTYMPSVAYATDDVIANPGVEAATEGDAVGEASEEVTVADEGDSSAQTPVGIDSVELLNGDITVTNTGKSAVEKDGIVTITAKAPATAVGTPETNTITIFNETENEAVLKFDYKASDCAEFSLSSDSGTYKKVLPANGSMTMHITAGSVGSPDATLELSNFSLEAIADSYDIKISYDNKLGGVTAGGSTIASGETKAVGYADGLALAATAADGAKFLGWIDAKTGELYSKEADYTIKPTSDEDIEAVFVNAQSDAFFLVAGKYLVEGFDAAADKAKSTSGKKMVLMNDATLAKGNYEVPAGVTLLIPFDDKNTLYTDEPKATNDAYVTPKAYRTLKLADGAELTVNGTLSLSAVHYAANGGGRGSGAPTGDVSFLDMEKGSGLVVNNGGYLYAYGFIVGEGTITAKNGATVYENFQIDDFRGGTATSDMAVDDTLVVKGEEKGKNHGVLPIAQYYVQNIEVPMTLDAGATEYTYTSVFMNNGIYGAAVAFISDRYAMFNLTSGNVVKTYDGTTDRLIVEANGDMSLSPITIKLKGVEDNIDSSQFELPINNNITVKINSGEVEINQDLALLPGSEIIIAKNAKCTLKNGANVYVYDADQWGGYLGSGNAKILPIRYAYSKKYDRTEKDLVDAAILVNGTLDASEGFLYTTTNAKYDTGFGNIYSTDKGVIKIVSGEETATYQATQTGTEIEYNKICILPANLKQDSKDNDEYLQTLDETVGTYTYTNGVWLCDHESTEKDVVNPTCTKDGSKTVTCEMEHEYKLVIPATGHKKVTDPAVKGSCTVDAKTEGSHCSVCNEVLVEQVITKAPGHTPEVVKGYAATCLKDGLTDGEKCSVCGEITVEQEVIESAGTHDWDVAGEVPTCTEDGYGSSKCKVCGEEIDKNTIPALGHSYKWTVTKAPTCTEEGAKEGVCQREGCGHKTTATVEATGHKFKTYVDDNNATCDKEGTATAKCENEGCTETATKPTEALGHIWKKDDNGQPLYEIVTEPKCEEKGTEAVHCERCDATDATRDVDALGHTEETIKAVLPTCEETGMSAGTKCSVCDKVLVEPKEEPSLGGHKWGEGVISSLPHVNIDQNTNAVTYVKGKRVFECTNTGCKEYKEETLEWGKITNYDDFLKNLKILEDWAFEYAINNNIEDPAALVIRYIRTGVDRYNSGSWQIMAGVDNTAFTDYVTEQEIKVNDKAKTDADKVNVTGLKNINNFTLPNGDKVDFGHMFGTIDISYTNKNSINHADVAGFFGDTTDLLTTADRFGVKGTIEEMVKDITDNYFLVDANWDDKFGNTDMLGDLDGYYLNRELLQEEYEKGMFTDIVTDYFTKSLTEEDRAAYYLANRLQCGSSKAAVRDAVYMAYTSNSVITTLEGTREFNASGDELDSLRKAVCYTVADYICRLAGDYVEYVENDCFTIQSEKFDTLAPGITQEIKTAKLKDGTDRNMKYYVATADITRDDVQVYANYPTRPIEKDENGNYVWDRKRVLDQANAAQETYGNPDSPLYIENFNVIASTNADGYDMTGDNRGEPGGLLVMDGEEIYPIKANGFFGITKEGKAVIGSSKEYNEIYRGQMAEAVGGFGTRLVEDGKIATTARGSYHSRTAVGITGSGKVVMMVLDGRQELSVGGDMLDLAHIMLDAGCVDAINLDGGGSSTYVAKQPGDENLSLMNNPSDGYQRDVASSLMAVSTAKSSTIFDKAVIKAPTNYMTVGSELQMTADGVTSTGNAVDVPEAAKWTVSDSKTATITADGKLTALRTGSVDVNLVLDDVVVGTKRITVVIPDKITFTKPSVDVVYDSKVALPIKAYYEGKAVTINASDFEFALSNEAAGKMEGLNFVAGPESTGLKRIDVTANVKGKENVTAKITVAIYKQGENTFDFDKRTGGDRVFAWQRTVSNSQTGDNTTYYAENKNKDMETSYVFAIDMTQIPIPPVLEELTDMLPGHDVEGACAWTYLCNLAQRISDITEVTATVKIDDNFELVDPKSITVKNDYFELTKDGVVYDEETNTVTLKLNWIRQYSPIDLEMANPLCLVNGIKIVPKKDADWGANETLNVVNEGNISYKVYMRASSLYTFANDKDNQAKYGLKPFKHTYIDKNGIQQEEAGGGFEDTYKTFKDTYNLVNAVMNGWKAEAGGWRYYIDGEPLTGIQAITEKVDGVEQTYYYNFGDEGIIKGNKKETYTGLIKTDDNRYSYSSLGVLVGGWIQIGSDWHYFDPEDKKSLRAGKRKLTITAQNQNDIDPGPGRQYETITNDVTYEFDETGKLVEAETWFTDPAGKIYCYYGPAFLCSKWKDKDGKRYYFTSAGYLASGFYSPKDSSAPYRVYYQFDNETHELIQKCEGLIKNGNYTYYYAYEKDLASGKYTNDDLIYGRITGLVEDNGKFYYFNPEKNGRMMTGTITIPNPGEGECSKVTFHKTYGYAVDKNGKARTSLKHSYSSAVNFVAPTSSSSAKYYNACTHCGDKKYTTKSAWEKYVKSYTKKTTVKVSTSSSRKTETITLTMKPSTSAVSYYKVQRATKKNGTYKTVASKVKTNKYIDTKATPGKTYYYKVTGYSYVGNTKYNTKVSSRVSSKITKTTKSYVKGTSMKASTAYKSKAVQVKWEAPRIKATRYEVYRATSKNGKYTKIATLKYGNLSYTDKKVKVGKKYYYKVRAYKTISGKKVYTKFSPKVSRTVTR